MHLLFNHPYVLYIFYFFICINFTFFIGHFSLNILSKFKQNTSFEVFSKLSFGIILILLCASIYWTKGNTIFLAFLFPIFFLIRKISFKINMTLPNYYQLFFLNIIAIPILLLQYLFYCKCGSWNLLPIDINNHAEISYFLQNGFESKYAALNSLGALNVPTKSPYHYTDNWLTAFFCKVLPNSHIGYTMMYVVFPILFTTLLAGIYTMIKQIKLTLKPIFIFLLAILFLFVGPIDIGLTRKIFDSGNMLSSNTVIFENVGFFFNTLVFSYHGQKHIPFYIISCWVIVLFSQTEEKKALYVLAFAPIINIGLIPGIIGGLGLLTIYQWWKTKSIVIPIKNSLPVILSTVFILLFYTLNGGYDIENQTTINTFSSTLNIKGEFLKVFYKTTYTLIFLILIYSVYFLIIFKKKKSIHSKTLTLYVLFSVSIVVFTRIIFEGFNTPQFISFLLPLVNLYIIYCFIVFFNKNSNYHRIIFACVILICFNNIYQTYFHATTRREISIEKIHDPKFIFDVNEKLLQMKVKPKIGYFLSDNDFKTIPPGFWYGYYPCEFLLIQDYFQFYSLNYPNQTYKLNSQKSNNFSPNHLRYIFPQSISLKTYQTKLVKFIKTKKINVIVAKQKSTLPPFLNSILKDSIIDNKTGDRFLLIE